MTEGLVLDGGFSGLDGFSSLGALTVVFSTATPIPGLSSSGVCSLGIRGDVVFCQIGNDIVKEDAFINRT